MLAVPRINSQTWKWSIMCCITSAPSFINAYLTCNDDERKQGVNFHGSDTGRGRLGGDTWMMLCAAKLRMLVWKLTSTFSHETRLSPVTIFSSVTGKGNLCQLKEGILAIF